jgi:diaminopimelate decarboxylase
LNIVEKNNFPTSKISFTSTGISKNLLKILIDKDININLDSVEEVEKFCMLSSNKTFGIRVKIPNTIQIQ